MYHTRRRRYCHGTIYKLFQCGFPLLVLEIDNPSCIRRTISFCEAVFDKDVEVEGVHARRVDSLEEAYQCYCLGQVPVMVDGEAVMIRQASPAVVIDAILAKKNLGTRITDAPVVIGVGPGFYAGKDVHAVVETQRGHNLGRVLYEGRLRRTPACRASLPVTEKSASSMPRRQELFILRSRLGRRSPKTTSSPGLEMSL